MEFAKDNFLMDFTKRSDTCDIYFEYNKKNGGYVHLVEEGGIQAFYQCIMPIY